MCCFSLQTSNLDFFHWDNWWMQLTFMHHYGFFCPFGQIISSLSVHHFVCVCAYGTNTNCCCYKLFCNKVSLDKFWNSKCNFSNRSIKHCEKSYYPLKSLRTKKSTSKNCYKNFANWCFFLRGSLKQLQSCSKLPNMLFDYLMLFMKERENNSLFFS